MSGEDSQLIPDVLKSNEFSKRTLNLEGFVWWTCRLFSTRLLMHWERKKTRTEEKEKRWISISISYTLIERNIQQRNDEN